MEKDFKLYIHISPSWKYYVGITSLKIGYRWGKNGHGYKTQYFQRAIEKYGWDNFIHIVVADKLSKHEACELEKIFIKELKSNNPKYGYNLSTGGECSNIGVHFSDETRKAMSENASISVKQYTKDGKFVRKWRSMREAGRELGIDESSIAKCCKGEYKTSKGFVWRYKDDEFDKFDMERYSQPKRRIRVKQFSTDGELIKVWNSITEIKETMGISTGMISACCKGNKKRKIVGGFVWRYENDDFCKYTISNERIKKVARWENGEIKEIYDSIAEAGRKNEIRPSGICMCCMGQIKRCGGIKWSYV